MKKMTFFAVMLMVAAALTSCGAKKQVAQNGYQQPQYYQQPYQQQPYQQQPAYQQPAQQPTYNQPAPAKRLSGPEKRVADWEKKGFEGAGNYGFEDLLETTKALSDKVKNNRDKYILISGFGTHATSEDAAHNAALQFAIQRYASQAGTVIKGRVDREYSNFSETDKLVTAYSGYIKQQLVGFMNEELAVRRQTEKGYEVEAWYTLDEARVQNVRKQAMEKALKEVAIEQIAGNNIRDYVNEAVPDDAENL